MQNYEIKRGHGQIVEEEGLANIVREVFGVGEEHEDGSVTTSFGALRSLRVRLRSPKVLEVETTMDPGVDDRTAAETIRRYNEFLHRTTGFTAKERKKRAQKR